MVIKRAMDALGPVIRPKGVNASGELMNPRLHLPALKAARDHIDRAIATIEEKWPA